jgi:hypothetical protein
MLDTIKLGIPLTQKQYDKIHAIAYQSEQPQWVLLIPITGEMRFRRITGLAEADQNSYHREIRWDIPATYLPPHGKLVDGEFIEANRTFLTVELSLPKFSYGHNIHLLYDFAGAIAKLKKLLERQFNLQTRAKLVDIGQWQVWRVDCCYAWRMPNQQVAQQVLDSLKHLHYPRKKPVIYPTSIQFAGKTYSVKFYLKLPEFKAHDRKALIKAKANLEWINHLENKADGVLRYETTLRRQYLQKQDINTVADLMRPAVEFVMDFDIGDKNPQFLFDLILEVNLQRSGVVPGANWLDQLEDGHYFDLPPGAEVRNDETGQMVYTHPGGGMTFRKRDNPTAVLQYFLDKFVGEHGMQRVDEVKKKLMETYKPVKAARLISFWLYVQKFGTSEAREVFGKNSYYTARSDLKKAGVSLIEAANTVVTLASDFLGDFKLKVPNQHTTNQFDDFENHDNVLNFVPRPKAQ